MSNFIKVSPLSSEYTTDTAINNVYVKDNTRGWLRYIRIGIFGVVLNSDNITYDLTGEAYEFSETEFDISFSIKYSSSSSDSTPTAEIALRNLSNELQWKLKKYMKITINAGYIGSNNNGLVFSGQIKNIVLLVEFFHLQELAAAFGNKLLALLLKLVANELQEK